MRVLGIDLGTKTMGIALSDPLRITVSGIDNFHHNENYDECINKIKNVLNKYKDIDTILIGNPIRMDGRESNMSLIANSFKDKLIKQISNTIKVLLFDERYSTKIAINELKNKYGKNNHEKIKSEKDKMAAIILVQEYIR
jgi:putative Holliday junction resolvase